MNVLNSLYNIACLAAFPCESTHCGYCPYGTVLRKARLLCDSNAICLRVIRSVCHTRALCWRFTNLRNEVDLSCHSSIISAVAMLLLLKGQRSLGQKV